MKDATDTPASSAKSASVVASSHLLAQVSKRGPAGMRLLWLWLRREPFAELVKARPVYWGALRKNLDEAFALAQPRGFCGIIQQLLGLHDASTCLQLSRRELRRFSIHPGVRLRSLVSEEVI